MAKPCPENGIWIKCICCDMYIFGRGHFRGRGGRDGRHVEAWECIDLCPFFNALEMDNMISLILRYVSSVLPRYRPGYFSLPFPRVFVYSMNNMHCFAPHLKQIQLAL